MMTKQVIVIRRDLKMRRGKECSQAAHASLAWLARAVSKSLEKATVVELTDAQRDWIVETRPEFTSPSFTKITCCVESEQEIKDIYEKAIAAGLTASLITDSGKTEFGGIPTVTACAVGPDWEDEVDKVTGNLKLY